MIQAGEVVPVVQNDTGWQNLSVLISDALLAEADETEIAVDASRGGLKD